MSEHGLVHSQPHAMLATRNDSAIALAEQAKATALARYQMAMMRPRDPETVRTRLLSECRRPSLAKAAVYEIPRGGATVRGPSIRLAEAAMRALGNVAVESVVVAETNDLRTVRVTVTDIETNMSIATDTVVRLTAERRRLRDGQTVLDTRINSEGKPVYLVAVSDAEQIQQQAAAVSKAMRGAVFRLLPGGLLDEAIEICKETARKGTEADADQQRRKMIDAWASFGVEPHELAQYLGHPLAQATTDEVDGLRRNFVAIKDGETTWSEIVQEKADTASDTADEAQPSKTAQVRDKVLKRNAKREAPFPVTPRMGEHEGVRWHTWAQHGEGRWRGEWSIPDEDLAGTVFVALDGAIVEHEGPQPDERVAAAVAWAFEVQP